MIKTLATAVLAASLITSTSTTASKDAYLEFAVYSKNSTTFSAIRVQAEKHLRTTVPGLLWWKRLQGKNGLFADVLVWTFPAVAKAASHVVQEGDRFQPFVTSINSVTHFGHYRSKGDAASLSEQLDTAH